MFAARNIKRLRLGLLLFFIALAVPTALLVGQAYRQLKWEAFHQHRVMAEELAARSDRKLQQLFNAEESRSFTDYSFLNVAGGTEASFIQRSPLSAFPVKGEIPGLLGYFQIDTEGDFTTPLLPQHEDASALYGIPADEREHRLQLQARLQDILSKNRLVSAKREGTERVRSRKIAPDESLRQKAMPAPSSQGVEAEDEVIAELATRPFYQDNEPDKDATAMTAPPPVEEVTSQVAFDRLSESPSTQQEEKKESSQNPLGRIEDLKLDSRYQSAPAPEKSTPTMPASKRRTMRKESNVLPVDEPASVAVLRDSDTTRTPVRITTFQSEIDPFEMRLLDSGHFVLFRKVWRNGQRYIQGALIEREAFLRGLFEPLFRETALSQMSDLAIAYRGDIFTAFASRASQRYLSSSDEMEGTLLYQGRLSAPLSEMELIFSIKHLPAGPGGSLLAWLTAILLLVLCGGLLLLYRLGVGQLTLARQQQDFVSAVSHELKTPLTSIRMYGEMLREGWASEEKKRSYYDFIYTESERLSRLINNVLQLARMRRNEQQIDLHPISVGELLDILHSKVSSQIEQAGFTLHLECDEQTRASVIAVDADSFTQIIINLVDNAIKFSAKAERRQIDIGCQYQSKGRILFTVRDHGPGVARDQMKKIFTLFYRSENELTRETVGTGIGLALVRQLASAMHAEVDILNREPGAEFRLIFPVAVADH
ncbi:MAG: HAMP domain-containing histidine kinase [Gammaproteobacteria bacterium]|nr:HAMP domain-containing histidine kinase [Gammaproteobacteria bacterium]